MSDQNLNQPPLAENTPAGAGVATPTIRRRLAALVYESVLLFGIVFTATDMIVPYILTQGGPFNSTQMITTWAYIQGINAGNLGEGAAVAMFLIPVLAFVSVAMLVFARRAEVT